MANTYMSGEQLSRAACAEAFKFFFDQANPDRPMTIAELDRWVFKCKGPVREYPADPSVKIDILYGHSKRS